MKRLPASPYRLVKRGEPGLACDEDGVALGAVTLVEKREQGRRAVYRVRPLREIEPALSAAYGSKLVQGDLARRITCLDAAARALNRGDVARAKAALSMMDLRALSREHRAKRMGEAPLAKYSPDQPRVPAGQPGGGQWTRGESGEDAPVQVAVNDLGVMTDAPGGLLPTPASITAADTAPGRFPEPPGTGNVREYPPAEAASLAPPPPGSKYVTLTDGSVLWTKYMNHGVGGPMLMPEDVSIENNVERAKQLADTYGEQVRNILEPAPVTGGGREVAMYELFNRGKAMDYQRTYGVEGFINRDYIDFGNYNYGVVAAAVGMSWIESFSGAAAINWWGEGDKSGFLWSDPRVSEVARRGFEDYWAGRVVPLPK